MRLLELKTLKMNDNYPLIISLNGKVEMGKDKDINLVDRDEIGCSFSNKAVIESTLNYFFSVCDVGLSPQCMWETDDCDYMSLFLECRISNVVEFNKNVEKMIDMFPELIHAENILLEIPKDKAIKDMVYMIEVAYPATWTVEFEIINERYIFKRV